MFQFIIPNGNKPTTEAGINIINQAFIKNGEPKPEIDISFNEYIISLEPDKLLEFGSEILPEILENLEGTGYEGGVFKG